MSGELSCDCGHVLGPVECEAGGSCSCPICGRTCVIPLKCPGCGTALCDGTVLCIRCGWHLVWNRRLQTERSGALVEKEPPKRRMPRPKRPRGHCPVCKAMIAKTDRGCTVCGWLPAGKQPLAPVTWGEILCSPFSYQEVIEPAFICLFRAVLWSIPIDLALLVLVLYAVKATEPFLEMGPGGAAVAVLLCLPLLVLFIGCILYYVGVIMEVPFSVCCRAAQGMNWMSNATRLQTGLYCCAMTLVGLLTTVLVAGLGLGAVGLVAFFQGLFHELSGMSLKGLPEQGVPPELRIHAGAVALVLLLALNWLTHYLYLAPVVTAATRRFTLSPLVILRWAWVCWPYLMFVLPYVVLVSLLLLPVTVLTGLFYPTVAWYRLMGLVARRVEPRLHWWEG